MAMSHQEKKDPSFEAGHCKGDFRRVYRHFSDQSFIHANAKEHSVFEHARTQRGECQCGNSHRKTVAESHGWSGFENLHSQKTNCVRVSFSVNYKLNYFDACLHSLKECSASASDSPVDTDNENLKALHWECIVFHPSVLQTFYS